MAALSPEECQPLSGDIGASPDFVKKKDGLSHSIMSWVGQSFGATANPRKSMTVKLTGQDAVVAMAEFAKQQKVEAQLRFKKLTSAIKISSIPLDTELVNKLAFLMKDEFEDIMEVHPGSGAFRKRESYLSCLRMFQLAVRDALAAITRFDEFSRTEGAFDRVRKTELAFLEQSFCKELFTFSNAVASLVEHSRLLRSAVAIPHYDEQRIVCFGTDGLHEFVMCVRNLIHHIQFEAGNWQVTCTFGEGHGISGTFVLDVKKIQRIRRRRSDVLNSGAEKYLRTCAGSVDLKHLVTEYDRRACAFHDWMGQQLRVHGGIALADYDRCVLERNRTHSRQQWKLVLGTFLRGGGTRSPLEFLDGYISSDVISEIASMSFGSSQQIDRIICEVDEFGACDEELRSMIEDWFRGSTPQ